MYKKIKSKLNFSFFLAILSLIFIVYTVKDYNRKSEISVLSNTSKELTPIGTITKDKKFYQSLDIGEIAVKKIEILLATYARKNDSEIQFIFKKGNQQKKIIENTKNILDNSNRSFELNFISNSSPLEIEISGIDSDESNSITAWGTKDFKLGKIKLNGVEIENSFNVIIEKNKFTITNLLFIGITIFIFGIFYIIIGIKNKLFYTAFIISYTLMTIRYPTNSFASEVWAEQGTNFLLNATTKTFLENIKILDYAYLPLTQRLISLFIIKILRIQENFIVVSNLFSITLISFFFSIINLKIFNKIELSSKVKFLISLYFILFYEPTYENTTFINFIYWGIFPCLLFTFLDFKKLKMKKLIIISVGTLMIMLSKGYFISFLPLYALLIIKTIVFKEKKEFYYITTSFIAAFIQFMIMRNYSSNQIINFKKLIFNLFDLYYRNFIFVLKNNRMINIYPNEKIFIFIFILFNILVIYILLKYKKEIFFKVFFYSNAIILGNLSVVIITNNYNHLSILFTRPFIISNIVMYFYIIYFMILIIKLLVKRSYVLRSVNKIKKNLILIVLSVLLGNVYCLNKFRGEIYFNNNSSHSEWEAYKKILNNKNYIIPINPEVGLGFWAMGNAKIIFNGEYEALTRLEILNTEINAIIIRENSRENFSINLFDRRGNLIENIKQLNNIEKNYSYFLINKIGVSKIELLKNKIKVNENYNIKVYGKKK